MSNFNTQNFASADESERKEVIANLIEQCPIPLRSVSTT